MVAERPYRASDSTRIRRRRLLAALGGTLAAGLAGCTEVTSQEFAASPVRLPEAVSEELGLAEVFTDSQTTTRERTVGDETFEVTITNEFAGYARNFGSPGTAWDAARPTLIERFAGIHGEATPGSGTAINVVASDLGIEQMNPVFIEEDTPVAGGEVTLLIPERARHDGEVRLNEIMAFHHAEALGVDELTSRGGNNYLVDAQQVIPDREFVPAGWSDWTPDERWVVRGYHNWVPEDPSTLRCLVCLGERSPESVFGIEEMPGDRVDEGETLRTESTLLFSAAPTVDPGPAFPLDPAEVFDAGYPSPMGGHSFGLGVIATPNAEVLGESVNPLARIGIPDLLTSDTGQDILARVGLTDTDEVEWLRGPEETFVITDWLPADTVSVLGSDVGLKSFAGIVSGTDGPWAVAVYVAKTAVDDLVFPAAFHRRPVGTPDGRELIGDGTGFIDRPWTVRALELTGEVFGSLVSMDDS